MGLLRSIKKRVAWVTQVTFDERTGFHRYNRFGNYIYIRHPRHYVAESVTEWLCKNILFREYMPRNGDFVVDLGAGYGEEAAYLAARSPGVNYLGVEAQPVIYECLANTFRSLGAGFRASPYAISESPVRFASQLSYASVGARQEGYIEIPTLDWRGFTRRYDIGRIDLLKMNIEGAEKDIILQIDDFSPIQRLIVSCHDFRESNGEGEIFRTKKVLTDRLRANGYTIKTFNHGIDWADDWIFADRS